MILRYFVLSNVETKRLTISGRDGILVRKFSRLRPEEAHEGVPRAPDIRHCSHHDSDHKVLSACRLVNIVDLRISISTADCVLRWRVKVHLKEGVLSPLVRDAEVCADVVLLAEAHFQCMVVSECRPFGAAAVDLGEGWVLEGAINHDLSGVDVDGGLLLSSAFVDSRAKRFDL